MCGGFQFLLISNLWGMSFQAVVVFGLGIDLLLKSVLGHWSGTGHYENSDSVLTQGTYVLGLKP